LTTERPKLETDRIRLTPGRPFMATSTGKVTYFSISSGARPSVTVNT